MKVHNYKYQTKQWMPEHEYNLYDFGARMYDPVLARFTTPDPLQQFNNPYMAMGGNPVSMIDPSGMWSSTGYFGSVAEKQEAAESEEKAANSGHGSIGPSNAGVAFYTQSPFTIAQLQMQYGTTYDQQSLQFIELNAQLSQNHVVANSNFSSTILNGANNYIDNVNGSLRNSDKINLLTNSNYTSSEGQVGMLYAWYGQIGARDETPGKGDDIFRGYMFEAQQISIPVSPTVKSGTVKMTDIWLGFNFRNNLGRSNNLQVFVVGIGWVPFANSTRVMFTSNKGARLISSFRNNYGGESFTISTSTQTLDPYGNQATIAAFVSQPGFVNFRTTWTDGNTRQIYFRIQSFNAYYNQYIDARYSPAGLILHAEPTVPWWYSPPLPNSFNPD